MTVRNVSDHAIAATYANNERAKAHVHAVVRTRGLSEHEIATAHGENLFVNFFLDVRNIFFCNSASAF